MVVIQVSIWLAVIVVSLVITLEPAPLEVEEADHGQNQRELPLDPPAQYHQAAAAPQDCVVSAAIQATTEGLAPMTALILHQ